MEWKAPPHIGIVCRILPTTATPPPGEGSPPRETYQALDHLQQLFHDHCNALVAEQPADDLEVWRPHKVPVAAVDA